MKNLPGCRGKNYTPLLANLSLKTKITKNPHKMACSEQAINTLARHGLCDVYCGARETVGGSSVSVVAGVRTVTTNWNGHSIPQVCCACSLLAIQFTPGQPFCARLLIYLHALIFIPLSHATISFVSVICFLSFALTLFNATSMVISTLTA
jgi:hypothetical protein